MKLNLNPGVYKKAENEQGNAVRHVTMGFFIPDNSDAAPGKKKFFLNFKIVLN